VPDPPASAVILAWLNDIAQPSDAFLRLRLAELVGWEFLQFVTATPIPRVRATLGGEAALDPAAAQVLDRTLGIALNSALSWRWPSSGERFGLYPLVTSLGDEDTSPAIELRRLARGTIPRIDESAPLQRIARDVYPALLLRANTHDLPPSPFYAAETQWLSHVALRHPMNDRFAEDVRADPELAPLFPDGGEDSIGFFLNTGIGAGKQATMLAYDLCAAAYQSLRLDDRLDHAAFVRRVPAGLDALRQLLRGEPVEVSARFGFAGVSILDGSTFELPWGRLRAPTRGEIDMAWSDRSRRHNEVVLESRFLLRAVAEPWGTGPADDSERTRQTRLATGQLSSTVMATRLALVLALDRSEPAAAIHSWTIVDNPVGQHPLLSRPLREPFALRTEELRASDHVLLRWAEVIADRYETTLGVAAQRLLTALSERDDPADGLIDAAIALESLFGAGSGELGFRISAACAYLLEPQNDSRRESLQRRINQLYGKRSRVVHGTDVAMESDDRDALVGIVAQVLRRLLWNRPDLIADNDRARRLILRVGDPTQSPTASRT
jgi:hypothetical protein